VKIEFKYNPIFGSTVISDVFISEFLPEMDAVCVKIYIYCLYLQQSQQEVTGDSMAKMLGIDKSVLGEKLIILESLGLVSLKKDNLIIHDLQQKELEHIYKERTSQIPNNEDTGRRISTEKNQAIKSISDSFFSGRMPPSWYGEIDLWFDKYQFSSDVMFMLFQQCMLCNALTKPYVRKVAESWASKGVRTAEQLEQYLKDFEKFSGIRNEVSKKLKFKRNMYEYEENIVEKWVYTYKYTFEIIEIALKKSINKANPTLALFDKIISDWFSKGLNTVDEINAYEEERRQKYVANSNVSKKAEENKNNASQKGNYEQRKYDDDFFDNFYTDNKTKNEV